MFLFGPVPSRRLGRSLGVDVIPGKRCSFNCIYCQLGPTTDLTFEISSYGRLDDFLSELILWLKNDGTANYITFAGSGEPTLNALLKDMILATKELTDIPVAVLSNGSLFHIRSVRESIMAADFVKATLTTADEKTFKLIHRTNENFTLAKHIDGLIELRAERKKGLYCLEIMFMEGINDSSKDVKGLAELIRKIQPDWVDLNTPTRPTYTDIKPVGFEKLKEIQKEIDYPSRILLPYKGEFEPLKISDDKLIEVISRHPDNLENISLMFGLSPEKTKKYLDKLVSKGNLVCFERNGKLYYKRY